MASSAHKSPFAPTKLAQLPPIDGIAFSTAEAGIRYKGRTDLMVGVLAPGSVAAGIVTQSKTRSAPVEHCVASLAAGGNARILVVNSGNSNAFTGMKGRQAVEVTVAAAAKAAGCSAYEVYVASTGVIGEPMDASKFAHLLDGLAQTTTADMFEPAARAILIL